MIVNIIDVGLGNISSIEHWVKRCQHSPKRISNVSQFSNDPIIIPGVASAGEYMNRLSSLKLDKEIISRGQSGQKIIGICLGFQIMTNFSEEDSGVKCLGLLNGTAKFFREKGTHNGWEDFKIDTREVKHDVFFPKKRKKKINGRMYFNHELMVDIDENLCTHILNNGVTSYAFKNNILKGGVMEYKTEQEEFWATEFGDNYINRNQNYISNISFFSKVIGRAPNIESIIEFGCNIGLNLKALNTLLPSCHLTGVEINKSACKFLNEWGSCDVINESIFNYNEKQKYDLSLVKGILIHINPEMLNNAYKKIYDSSKKYILIAEYYNPTPVSISYRGHKDRLFKRDFAGELLDKYSDLKLVDYGFLYHRDYYFQKDDLTWFLLEKN